MLLNTMICSFALSYNIQLPQNIIIYLSTLISEYFGCFQILDFVNCQLLQVVFQVSFVHKIWNYIRYVMRNVIAESKNVHTLYFSRYGQTVFQNGNLQFHFEGTQQGQSTGYYLPTCNTQNIDAIFHFLTFIHSLKCLVRIYWCFNLLFLLTNKIEDIFLQLEETFDISFAIFAKQVNSHQGGTLGWHSHQIQYSHTVGSF